MDTLKESQLIINPDGTIYHLKTRPEDIADTVLLVGDPGRVSSISKFFDKVETKVQNREIITHTGSMQGKRITVISTGIGPDNIDIVINELDALVNVDFKNRSVNQHHRTLNLIRLGTSGTIQPDIPINSFGLGSYAMGLDNLPGFYANSMKVFEEGISVNFIKQTKWPTDLPKPYVVKATQQLENIFKDKMHCGITLTAPGFYGPQGRMIRLEPAYPDLNKMISTFNYNDLRVINYEMESSALYTLGTMLGHNVLTVCAILANRANEEYTSDPSIPVDALIEFVLERISLV